MKYHSTDKISVYDFFRLFGAYLRQEVFTSLSMISEDHIEIIYGNTGLFIKNNQLNIKDYGDRLIPGCAIDISQSIKGSSGLATDLQKLAKEIDMNSTLRAELAFDICK
jgi:hypothetical protein